MTWDVSVIGGQWAVGVQAGAALVSVAIVLLIVRAVRSRARDRRLDREPSVDAAARVAAFLPPDPDATVVGQPTPTGEDTPVAAGPHWLDVIRRRRAQRSADLTMGPIPGLATERALVAAAAIRRSTD